MTAASSSEIMTTASKHPLILIMQSRWKRRLQLFPLISFFACWRNDIPPWDKQPSRRLLKYWISLISSLQFSVFKSKYYILLKMYTTPLMQLVWCVVEHMYRPKHWTTIPSKHSMTLPLLFGIGLQACTWHHSQIIAKSQMFWWMKSNAWIARE